MSIVEFDVPGRLVLPVGRSGRGYSGRKNRDYKPLFGKGDQTRESGGNRALKIES